MKYKRINVSKDRFIDIYDDVFDFAEVSKMAMYVKRSTFKLERVPSVDLPDYLKFPKRIPLNLQFRQHRYDGCLL